MRGTWVSSAVLTVIESGTGPQGLRTASEEGLHSHDSVCSFGFCNRQTYNDRVLNKTEVSYPRVGPSNPMGVAVPQCQEPRFLQPVAHPWLLLLQLQPAHQAAGSRERRCTGTQCSSLHRALLLISQWLNCHHLFTAGCSGGPATNSAAMKERESRHQETTSCFIGHRAKPEDSFLTSLPLSLQLSCSHFLAFYRNDEAPFPSELQPHFRGTKSLEAPKSGNHKLKKLLRLGSKVISLMNISLVYFLVLALKIA